MTTSHEPERPVTRRVRVLLAIDGLGIGGAEVVVRDLATELDRRRFDVAVCCTKVLGSIGESMLGDGHDVFVLPARGDGQVDYLTPLRLLRAVRHRAVDIVHTHSPSAFWDAALCRLVCPRLKVVNTFHFGNYPHVGRSIRWLECTASRIVDRLVAVGRWQRQQILTTYRLPAGRLDSIWNGVADPRPVDTRDFAMQIAAGGQVVVGAVAKLIPQKGLDDLLLVAKRCRELAAPLKFVVLGEGPLRQQLEHRRRELGVEDSVMFAGWVDDAANCALPAIDVFFQPSRWEAMSIAVLEAMAAGKAIVATRVGDNPHVIEDGTTGLLVNVGDIEGMVDALTRASDGQLRRTLGAAARARFEGQFTLQHMARAYERLYGELAEQ
jgi:glycosyltransferase involved in cell wall biosynthesis